jgi:penicillin-binding protein-related factor A (putative recombinase)
MNEKQIENQILAYLSKRGIFSFKIQSTGMYDPRKKIFRKSNNPYHINGVSDILGVMEGRMIAIEVKRPYISKKTGKIKHKTQEELRKMASDDQIAFLNKVEANGGVSFIADSLEVLEEQLLLVVSKLRNFSA